MKTLWLVPVAFVALCGMALAHLNGTYGGQADGSDVNGAALHQITKWTFKSGKLMAFTEVITFPDSNQVLACSFVSSAAAAPLPYFTNMAPNNNNFVLMHGFGCPLGSTNERPEMLLLTPERNDTEFSYLVYTSPFAAIVDPDVPAHFSGHAVREGAR